MKKTDIFSISIGATFALLLGGIILSYNNMVNASVKSSEIKEAKIVKSVCNEDINESMYDKINKKYPLMFKEVAVNKYITIDSNNNGIKDDNDIVFEGHFSTNLPRNGKVSFFNDIPSEIKETKDLKNIKGMPKYIVANNKLYVYLPEEGSSMLYLNNEINPVPLAVKNQNGKYDILNLPSNIYGKKAKLLDEQLYDIIERKQNLR